jgi:hypothetical protein
MIQKENGEINKGLFFENVRDFLGNDNPVNEEIARTIKDSEERDRFAILNNGVTIVARSVTPSGDTFRLSQFQVVNGCQTSHVLFNNRATLTNDMYITVKLIETSDVDLSGKVIATTNSQSLVTKESFATIRPYHRSLEDFFNAMRSTGSMYYYERRPHQYDDRDDIRQHNIVSAPSLIKSFVSVALEEPHKVHYYYGTLLQEYNRNRSSELFSDEDYPGLYFAAHHIASRTRALTVRDRALAEWSFHLALLIKKQITPELRKGTALTDKRFLEVMKKIDQGFDQAYARAVIVLKGLNLTTNQNRIPEVTKRLLEELGRSHASTGERRAASASPPATARPELTDGNYLGRVESTDEHTNQIKVKYGPYTIVGGATDADAMALGVGARVMFIVRREVVTVAVPPAAD